MPIYEYTCQECKHDFVVTLSIKEMEAKPAQEKNNEANRRVPKEGHAKNK